VRDLALYQCALIVFFLLGPSAGFLPLGESPTDDQEPNRSDPLNATRTLGSPLPHSSSPRFR